MTAIWGSAISTCVRGGEACPSDYDWEEPSVLAELGTERHLRWRLKTPSTGALPGSLITQVSVSLVLTCVRIHRTDSQFFTTLTLLPLDCLYGEEG